MYLESTGLAKFLLVLQIFLYHNKKKTLPKFHFFIHSIFIYFKVIGDILEGKLVNKNVPKCLLALWDQMRHFLVAGSGIVDFVMVWGQACSLLALSPQVIIPSTICLFSSPNCRIWGFYMCKDSQLTTLACISAFYTTFWPHRPPSLKLTLKCC